MSNPVEQVRDRLRYVADEIERENIYAVIVAYARREGTQGLVRFKADGLTSFPQIAAKFWRDVLKHATEQLKQAEEAVSLETPKRQLSPEAEQAIQEMAAERITERLAGDKS